MLRRCKMDLHIHSLLSPCAEVEMVPELIIRQAEAKGLDLIAICDHNSAENVTACIEAARYSAVKVLPGIECESMEGVHVLGLFDRCENALKMQDFLWERMPDEPNRPEFFGAQMVVTANAEFVRYNERLLATSVETSLEEVITTIRALDGLPVPAHIDKTYAGLFGVLGFIPEGLALDGIEISPRLSEAEAKKRYPQLQGLGCIKSSDAHRLDEIGQCSTAAWLERRTIEEVKLALCGRLGRYTEEN